MSLSRVDELSREIIAAAKQAESALTHALAAAAQLRRLQRARAQAVAELGAPPSLVANAEAETELGHVARAGFAVRALHAAGGSRLVEVANRNVCHATFLSDEAIWGAESLAADLREFVGQAA